MFFETGYFVKNRFKTDYRICRGILITVRYVPPWEMKDIN